METRHVRGIEIRHVRRIKRGQSQLTSPNHSAKHFSYFCSLGARDLDIVDLHHTDKELEYH